MTDVQPELFIIDYLKRGEGWARHLDRVVLVEVVAGQVGLRTGHICSWPGSHLNIDNQRNVKVWCDEMIDNLADDADDAYEITCEVKDPNLVKVGEAELLKINFHAFDWFAGVHPIEVIPRIVSALNAHGSFARPPELAFP